jgi:hypothetical protein
MKKKKQKNQGSKSCEPWIKNVSMFKHIPTPIHTFAVPNKTAVIFDLIIGEIGWKV